MSVRDAIGGVPPRGQPPSRGPSGQWWRRRRAFRAAVVLPAVALLAMVFVGPVSAATTVLAGSASNFESGDGNMTLEATGNTDWNCFVNSDNFQTGTRPAGCKVTSGATQQTADPTGELELKPGTKFDTNCPIYQTGNNPPKDEFTNIAEYSDVSTATATLNDTFLYAGAIRQTNNGNASGNVEFDQSNTVTTGCRTAGDKLLAYEFQNGGTQLVFHVLTWIPSGSSDSCFVSQDSAPCWRDDGTPSGDVFNGLSNQSAIAAADNGINGQALGINQFLEFGADLTKLLNLTGCVNFPQNIFESRSSGSSFTSNPEDVEVENHRINTCGEVTIIKQTDPRGQNQVFNFSSANSPLPTESGAGGVACTAGGTAGVQADGSFCLNDTGNASKTLGSTTAANNSTGNTIDETDVPAGTYTVTEGTEPGAFSFESLSCSATTGSSGAVSGETATITLLGGGHVTCLYENQLHSGAIVITKTGKDVNCASASTSISNGVCTGAHTADLSGATFKVTTDAAGNNAVTGSPVTTGSNGTVCIGNLNWATGGTTYYVTETGAPTGYSIDNTAAVGVTVSHNANCGDSTVSSAATQSFSDSPLTDISLNSKAEVSGTTSSTITCTNSSSANIGNSPQTGDNKTVTATGLAPGTYNCQVVIDP